MITRTKLANGLGIMDDNVTGVEKVFGNVTVIGNVHGQYFDFVQIFEINSWVDISDSYHLKTINSISMVILWGNMAVEILIVLMLFKVPILNSLYILRGNHETTTVNAEFGFQTEVLSKYDLEILQKFRVLFNVLPFEAVIEDTVFVTHGPNLL